MDRMHLHISDGRSVEADLASSHDADRMVLLCHPHPLYGGNRFERVIEALFLALPERGVHTMRFDFRTDDGSGVGERLDALAALDALTDRLPGLPLHLVGYSFGAGVALTLEDDRIRTRTAIAPVLQQHAGPPPAEPTFVVIPEHDQFCDPATAAPILDAWPEVASTVVPMTDHFLGGRITETVDLVVEWVLNR